MTNDDSTKDTAAKSAALKLLRQGKLTLAEATKLAGVSRQLMRHWTKGLDLKQPRNAVLAKLWDRTIKRYR